MNNVSRFRNAPGSPRRSIRLRFNGKPILASPGESVAAAVLGAQGGPTRHTPGTGAPRAPYCMMGICFDCLMTIDGVPNVQACMTEVRDGMTVEQQTGAAALTGRQGHDPV